MMQNVPGCAHPLTIVGGHGSLQEWPESSTGVALESMIMTQRWNERASAIYEDSRLSIFAACSGQTTSIPQQPGASLSGSFGSEGAVGAVSGAGQVFSAIPNHSTAKLFALDNTEVADGHRPNLQRASQQLSSAQRPGVVEGALPGGGGDTGSATSASDGTVQCPELPATRNPSTSPINSPLTQMNTVVLSGSVAFPSCSPPLRQPIASATQTTVTAVNGACSEAAGFSAAFDVRPDSASAGAACEAEDALPSGSWRIEPETLKQEAMQGFASKNPHLPSPVRVTVGPNAFRQQPQPQPQQQQQQLPPALLLQQSAAKKRGRESVEAQQLWCSADGDESDGQKKRSGTSRGAAVRGARRIGDNPDDKPVLYGMFYPDRYMVGVDCILVDGGFVSRSRFEKLGGSLMAKWYRSIRVVDTAEPLGTWLDRHGLPVFTGKARQRRQRATPATKGSTAASASSPATGATINTSVPMSEIDKAQRSSSKLGLGMDTGVRIHGVEGMWPGASNVKKDTELLAATGTVPVGVAAFTSGLGRGEAEPSTAQGPCSERLPEKNSGLEGAMSTENFGRALMLGKGSLKFGHKLQGPELLDAGPSVAVLPQPSLVGCLSGGIPSGPSTMSPVAAAAATGAGIPTAMGVGSVVAAASPPGVSPAGGTAVGNSGGSSIQGRQSAGGHVARAAFVGLETLPNGAVAPGVYLIGGRGSGGGLSVLPVEQQQQISSRLPSPLPQQPPPAHQQQHDYNQRPHQQQQHPRQQQQGHMQQQQQPLQQGPQATGGSGWRSGMDGGASTYVHDLAATPAYHLPDPSVAAREGTSWGTINNQTPCAGEAAGLSIHQFGSDGGAAPAVASHLSMCTGMPNQTGTGPQANDRMLVPSTAIACPSGSGAGATQRFIDAIPAQTSSCRLPETSSLESVPTSAISRWPSASYMPSAAANGLVQYGSYEPSSEGGCPSGRQVWDVDGWSCPYGPLPSVASAPVKQVSQDLEQQQLQQQQQQLLLYQQQEPQQQELLLQQQQEPQQQSQELYMAMSRQQTQDSPATAAPACWNMPPKPLPALRARESVSAPSQFSNAQDAQQAFQEEGPSFSMPDSLAQPAPSANGATVQSMSISEAADNRPTSTAPGVSSSTAAESSCTLAPVTSQKPGHPYAPAGRQWPYGTQYWPYHPYPGHARPGAGLSRHSAAPVGTIRPYYRYPRDMPPGGGMPPSPAPLPPPYGYYYPHPYQRRTPPIYRRRFAISAPGVVDGQPGVFGPRYDTTAMYGLYGSGRPEIEAPMDPTGSMPYPAAGEYGLDDVGPTGSASGCLPATASNPMLGHNVTSASIDAATAMSAGAGHPGCMGSGDLAAMHSEPQCLPMPPMQQQLLQSQLPPPPMLQQQQHRINGSASPYCSSWPAMPKGMRPLNANHQLLQPLPEGMGIGAELRMTGGMVDSENGPNGFKPVGMPSAAAAPGPSAVATAGTLVSNQFVTQSFYAAATAATSGAASLMSTTCALDADVDPMWAHFQRWSAEETGRAPEHM